MSLEVLQEILFADATKLMCQIPHRRWGVINDSLDGEVAHNPRDWLGGIDIDLIHIRALEYPFAVFIHLATIEDCLAEDWSCG